MRLSSWRTVILCWCVVPFTLASCKSGPQLPVESVSVCASGQTRSSCFYREDSQHANTKLIIFVHGVFGSKSTTWGDPTADTFWPKLIMKDPRFAEGFDIYLVNYRTSYVQEASNIHEIAGNELGKLENRGVFTRYQEIHFITHSMGGLVAKSMLTRLNRGEDVKKLRKVTSVVYLATPAQGARTAELGDWLSLNPQLRDMGRAHLNTYIQTLEDQWVQLIEDRDKAKGEFPRAYCAYETGKVGPLLVVPRELAFSRCDGGQHSMPFNHLGIAEPTMMDDDPYLWTMAKIVEAGTTGQTRWEAATLVEEANRLVSSGKNTDARKAYDDSRALYKKIQDTHGIANVLRRLGNLDALLGRNDEARSAYTEARSLFHDLGDRVGEADVLVGLGDLESLLGRHDQAKSAYTVAHSLYEAESHRRGEASVLVGLGTLEGLLGAHDKARKAYTNALSLYHTEGNQSGKANALMGLGDLERLVGRHKEARDAYAGARSLFQNVGDQLGEGNVWVALGGLERQLGGHDKAREAYGKARSIYRTVGHRFGEAQALNMLGELEPQTNGQLARQYLYQAALLFEQIEMHDRRDQALKQANNIPCPKK